MALARHEPHHVPFSPSATGAEGTITANYPSPVGQSQSPKGRPGGMMLLLIDEAAELR